MESCVRPSIPAAPSIACGAALRRRGVWIRAIISGFWPERRAGVARQWLQSTGIPGTARLLLYAGRLAPQKNLDLLIAVIAQFERRPPGAFHLLLAGDGSMRRARKASFAQDIVDHPPDTAARIRAERSTACHFELYDESHTLVSGGRDQSRLDPAFYSTAGNRFGWEIR